MWEVKVEYSGKCETVAYCDDMSLVDKLLEKWWYPSFESAFYGAMTVVPYITDESDIYDARPHYVYFIRLGWFGPIKIGVTVNPEERIKDISVHCPEEIRLLCLRGPMPKSMAFTAEAELKRFFRGSVVRGEWLEPTDILINQILFYRDQYKGRVSENILEVLDGEGEDVEFSYVGSMEWTTS